MGMFSRGMVLAAMAAQLLPLASSGASVVHRETRPVGKVRSKPRPQKRTDDRKDKVHQIKGLRP